MTDCKCHEKGEIPLEKCPMTEGKSKEPDTEATSQEDDSEPENKISIKDSDDRF